MKKVIVEMGFSGQMVMEIPEESYRKGVFYIPLFKNIGASWSENLDAADDVTTKKLVFRRYGDGTFSLVGWED